MQGNTGSLLSELEICDEHSNCVKTLDVAPPKDAPSINLAFDFDVNGNHNIWRYKADTTVDHASKPLSDDLIVLFAGYNQPVQISFVHQLWLHHITGATVLAVPSANQAKHFAFGLNYVSPIVQEIHRRAPENVHLIGFSMAALTASKIANEIENSRLYLFAPMTNFEDSAQAIWDRQYAQEWYAAFVPDSMLNKAVERVYEKAGKTPKETNLLSIIDDIDTDVFVYTSTSDKVTDAAAWYELPLPNIHVRRYDNLNHIEMMAMIKQRIMADFASDILERYVSVDETSVIGVLCAGDDEQCQREQR